MGKNELPEPDVAAALSTPALAALLLAVIATDGGFAGRRRTIRGERSRWWGENATYLGGRNKQSADPKVDRNKYSHAVSAAFDWLYVEGLTTREWDPGPNHREDEWFGLTAEGWHFLERGGDALDAHRAEKLLGFRLHEAIDGRVRQLFLIGETEAAVMIAMKEVEVRMREAASLPNDLVGVKLAREAFKPDSGPLADPGAEPGERVATMELFAGAMGTLRNPVAHRRVDYDDPVQAVEVILFADLLLRMIDRAKDASK